MKKFICSDFDAKKIITELSYSPLAKAEVSLFYILCDSELNGLEVPQELLESNLVKIAKNHIKAYNLPLDLTDAALCSTQVFCKGNPGKVVAFLIALSNFVSTEDEYRDWLNFHESKILNDKPIELKKQPVKLTVNDIAEKVFPLGFYGENSFECLVDFVLKPKLVAYSGIY